MTICTTYTTWERGTTHLTRVNDTGDGDFPIFKPKVTGDKKKENESMGKAKKPTNRSSWKKTAQDHGKRQLIKGKACWSREK